MYKLKIYLKSGQTMTIKCKEYKFTYQNDTLEYCGYSFEGHKGKCGIVPNQIAAWELL